MWSEGGKEQKRKSRGFTRNYVIVVKGVKVLIAGNLLEETCGLECQSSSGLPLPKRRNLCGMA